MADCYYLTRNHLDENSKIVVDVRNGFLQKRASLVHKIHYEVIIGDYDSHLHNSSIFLIGFHDTVGKWATPFKVNTPPVEELWKRGMQRVCEFTSIPTFCVILDQVYFRGSKYFIQNVNCAHLFVIHTPCMASLNIPPRVYRIQLDELP